MTMKTSWSDVDKPGICRVNRDFSATGIPFMKWLASLYQVVIAKWVGLEKMYMPWSQVAIIVFLLLLLVLILTLDLDPEMAVSLDGQNLIKVCHDLFMLFIY